MKALFVAGSFDGLGGKPSGYMLKLQQQLKIENFVNGGYVSELLKLVQDMGDYQVVLWMADVPNGYPNVIEDFKKHFPKTLLVVSKRNLDGDNYTVQDIVTRALKLKANLTLILTGTRKDIAGEVLDPLGVSYCCHTDIAVVGRELMSRIKQLLRYTRVGSVRIGGEIDVPKEFYAHGESEFFNVVKMQADRFHEIIHGVNHERMLGNASFRCARGFPSMRKGGIAYVSRRNVDKRFIGPDAFVAVDMDSLDPIQYYGEHKPSVDTPVQVRLYRYYQKVRYMVHSHTYIEGAPTTREPIPCGAIEEAELIKELVPDQDKCRFAVNLLGHGSIAFADTVDALRGHPWKPRPVPELVNLSHDPYLRGAAELLGIPESEVTKQSRQEFKVAFFNCLRSRLLDEEFARSIAKDIVKSFKIEEPPPLDLQVKEALIGGSSSCENRTRQPALGEPGPGPLEEP